MDESFEYRPLLARDTLRSLQQRQDLPSLIRLTLQLSAFVLCGGLVVSASSFPLVAALFTILLAAIWATLFAPFHECTHQTAFRSRRLNAIGTWLTGIPFGMAPAVYRLFHFAHHRYTHDPTRDPEIGGAPQLASWPTNTFAWFFLISGVWLLRLKATGLVKFSVLPTAKWAEIAPWAPPEQRARLAWETRVVALVWLALVAAAFLGIPGAQWLLVALILSHLFQAVWLATEHTGLPSEGTILARTRTMRPSAFIRWWLWNMNYHAEHHAWPAIPWYALPVVHERIAAHLDHQAQGYWRLQLDVLRCNNLPDGSQSLQAEKGNVAL
jgi:fatty acid desaturase